MDQALRTTGSPRRISDRRGVARRVIRGLAPVCALLALPLAGQETATAELAHLVARARADIEAFRFASGGRLAQSAPWAVGTASPRHAFHTGQTLFRKVSRLTHEVIGTEMTAPPAVPAGVVTVDAAVDLVRSAHDMLLRLLDRVGVEPTPVPPPPPGQGMARTLAEMVAANRQLNAMLVHEYRPAEIRGLVEQAVRHLAALTGEGYPDAPRPAGGLNVTSVYRKLLDCYGLVHEAGAARDIATLGLDLRAERRREGLESSDAYDLAQLLLADIAFMSGGASAPAPPYRSSSYVHSAHVYRMASVLETQLGSLVR